MCPSDIRRAQWLGAGKQFDQRRFPCSIHAHQRNAVAAFDHEIHVAEDMLFSVALGHVLELGHNPPAGLGLRKREVNGLFFLRDLDALDLVQFFDAALHLLGFCRLVAKAVDERFQLLDALALIAVRRFELVAPLLFCARYLS